MLEVRRVCSGYPGMPVLFDVSLDVQAGELVAVLGGNGAGKSTLLKTILGDVRATSGEVILDGRPVTSLPTHRRVAAGISYSPEGRRIFSHLSTRENLIAGSYGAPTRKLGERLDLVYQLFPLLGERADQRAGSLSGGEQQMLALGRALMPLPRVLMAEELSLGLAPIVVTHLYAALRALCERGLAVIVSEQFQRLEEEYTDRWIVLERGTVVAEVGGR